MRLDERRLMLPFVVDALAAYRLTRLVTQDRIAYPARYYVQQLHPMLDELLDCPHCAGVWIAAGVTAARLAAPRRWAPVARFLATAGAVSVIASLIERADDE